MTEPQKPSVEHKSRGAQKQKGRGGPGGGSSKLRSLPKDSPEVRVSKTLSWILRHGAKAEGLPMREDGFVRVADLLATPKIQTTGLHLERLQEIVRADGKQRYTLLEGPDAARAEAGDVWWIRANQGHSMKDVKLDLKPVLSVDDIPMAVHGTNKKAWDSISTQGLSKMTRNHIHLAQGVPGDGVLSGMRASSQVYIYIDVQKALDAGFEFFLSENGVVLTEGDSRGFLGPEYFSRVEDRNGQLLAAVKLGSIPPGETEGAAATVLAGAKT
ncbi:hypothetical protein FA95DRAFT_1001351 [Auriscalpium vulgare]|uniref:Uncharacterized protein n=1 Tax=Auriscalpium vulgare TaxID=40419 RepID=A0ACB8R7U3_9AGAM|nr:hypothetical protein FA95DRAFT_1001351 [Auriscalpium vulgare]